MKLNTLGAFLGALLIAGSIEATATIDQVKDVLKSILPENAPSTDVVITHCFGGLTNNFWAQTYINEKLAADIRTQKCSSSYYSWLVPSILTLNNSYDSDSCTKLMIIREGDEVICGLKIFIKDGKVEKTEYINASTTKTLKDKSSVSSTWYQWGNPMGLFWWPAYYTGTVTKYAIGTAFAVGAIYKYLTMTNKIDALEKALDAAKKAPLEVAQKTLYAAPNVFKK